MNKKINFLINLQIIVFICFSIFALNNELEITGDNATYLIFAKSLLLKQKLIFLNEPTEPISGYNIFVYPLILIPFINFNISIIKSTSIIFSLLSVLIFYLLFKNRLNIFLFLSSFALFVFNPVFFDYSHQIMSEALYLFLTLLFFYFVINNKSIIIITFLLIIIYFTRTAGLVCFISYFIYLFIKRQFKKLIIITIIFLVFIFSISSYFNASKTKEGNLYFSIIKMKSQYTPDSGVRSIKEIFLGIIKNLIIYIFKIFPDTFLFPFFFDIKKYSLLFFVKIIFGFILFLLFIIGFLKIEKLNFLLIKIYIIINFIMLLVWQISSNRYLMPLIPFIIIFIIFGIYHLIKNFEIKKLIILFLILINFFGIIYLTYLENKKYKTTEWRNYYSMLSYIKKNCSNNEVIMTRKPTLAYFLADKKTIGYPLTNDFNQYLNAIQKNNVSIIVQDNLKISGLKTAELYLIPFINFYKDKLKIIFKIDDNNIVYQIKK
ncbi:MAG TPA: hypothetical protein PLD27_06430 [bacterium]|nr:hypothetical protein [bacterium]HOL47507.1 hypothetical protein [bacterium]HPQ18813.1 hypothetical protein [bacterium]